METRAQSRSKLPSPTTSATDDGEKAADPTIVPKSSLAARLEKREAMKRNSTDTNHGEQESDSSDGGAPSTMSERPKMQKARKQKPLTRTKSRQERGNQEE